MIDARKAVAAVAGLAGLLALLTGCGKEPLCGYVDEEAEELVERPSCTYELADGATIDYCPGDQWGATDGCNSCGCDNTGRVVCTKVVDCAE